MARSKPNRPAKNAIAASASKTRGQETPWLLWIVPVLTLACLGWVIFAMTPYTYNLDDIKMTLLLYFGGLLLPAALGAIACGLAPAPPRFVAWGLGAYVAIMLVSLTASEFRWVGWPTLLFTLASVGFFLGGVSLGATRQTSRIFLMFIAIVLLLVNLFGFFQYDIFNTGEAGVSKLYRFLYGNQPRGANPSGLQHLLFTFSDATSEQLMSTILNRDFYAGFCLLYLPLAVALALSSHQWRWRAIGILTALFSLLSIFLCKSKGEYFIALASIAFFTAFYVLVVRHAAVRGSYLATWAGGIGILLLTFLFVNSPTLMGQLKTVSGSFASRKIMFAGAWDIFKEFPILGGGPGSYRIYFPRFRASDYFDHEISHVTIFSHNLFLDMLAETGILGFAAFVFFAGALALLGFRALFRAGDSELKLMILAALCGLLGIYGSNMTSPNGRWPIGAVGLWTVMGFLAGLVRQESGWNPAASMAVFGPLKGRGPAPPAWMKPAFAALGIFAVVAMVGSWREGARYWDAALDYNVGKQTFMRYELVAHQALLGKAQLNPEQREFLIRQLEDSSAAFKRATERYPEHLSSYYQRGSVENILATLKPSDMEKHLENARIDYETLQKLAPDYAELHYNLGVIYYRISALLAARYLPNDGSKTPETEKIEKQIAKYREMSLASYQKMGSMSQKADAMKRLGETYMDQRSYKLAQELLRGGINRYPDDEALVQGYLRASRLLGDRRGEVDALKRLWLMMPGRPGLLFGPEGCLDIALAEGFDDQFEEILNLALDRNPVDPNLYARMVKFNDRQNNFQRAVQAGKAYVKLRGTEEDILQLAAKAAREVNDAESLKAFEAAMSAG